MRLSPSLYAADPLRLGAAIAAMAPHVGSLHLDIMDGRFAPAFGMSGRLVEALASRTTLALDVHLMVADPAAWGREFAGRGARRVAFHLEAVTDPRRVADEIRGRGALAYLALQPSTPLAAALPFLGAVDGVLLLTAPAGGGAFEPEALRRRCDLPAGVPVIVDGGLGAEHVTALRAAPVELVVVGRALFDSADPAVAARAWAQALQAGW